MTFKVFLGRGLVSLLNTRFTQESVEHLECSASAAVRLFDSGFPDLLASGNLSGDAFCPDNPDPIGIVRVGVEIDHGALGGLLGATTHDADREPVRIGISFTTALIMTGSPLLSGCGSAWTSTKVNG